MIYVYETAMIFVDMLDSSEWKDDLQFQYQIMVNFICFGLMNFSAIGNKNRVKFALYIN